MMPSEWAEILKRDGAITHNHYRSQSDVDRRALIGAVRELTQLLENLRQYAAVEGRPDGESLRVGLAYKGSVWGPQSDPEYPVYELAEAVEEWLKNKTAPFIARFSVNNGGSERG